MKILATPSFESVDMPVKQETLKKVRTSFGLAPSIAINCSSNYLFSIIVIETADECCKLLQHQERILQHQKFQLASLLGYKGFALLKKERSAEALSCLEESKYLREQLQKSSSSKHLRPQEAEVVDQSLRICYQRLRKPPPLPSIIKYPRTTHLFDSGGTSTTVDDLVLPDLHSLVSVFCNGQSRVVIEEKVDGANLGISLCPYTNRILVQNRSHYISQGEHAQFSRIPEWIEQHREALMQTLEGGNKILYGEWLAAKHSIQYRKLPGYFVAFDLYDKRRDQFYSRRRFHSTMKDSNIPVVPVITAKTFGPYTGQQQASNHLREELIRLLDTKSAFRIDNGTVEGIVLRVDGSATPYDKESGHWLEQKFKVVRPDFVRGCGESHWAARQLEKQQVDFEFAEEYAKCCYKFA